MPKLYETRSLYVDQPWEGAGLRIIDKAFDRPYWPSGAFYDNMGGQYPPKAIDAARKATDRIQSQIDTTGSKVEIMKTHFFTNDNGQIFCVAKSSRPGLLHVSLTTGSQDFLGYVETVDNAVALIARRFGSGVRPH